MTIDLTLPDPVTSAPAGPARPLLLHPPLPYNEVTAPLYLAAGWVVRRLPIRSERGQATAEYALVLLGAIAAAVALFAYLKKSGHLENMMKKIFGKVDKKLDENLAE